jgi:predicted transcriptional regulator
MEFGCWHTDLFKILMAQDQVEALLRANRRREMTAKEVATEANIHHRTASQNLQDLTKWRITSVRSYNGVKRFRIADDD